MLRWGGWAFACVDIHLAYFVRWMWVVSSRLAAVVESTRAWYGEVSVPRLLKGVCYTPFNKNLRLLLGKERCRALGTSAHKANLVTVAAAAAPHSPMSTAFLASLYQRPIPTQHTH